MKRFFVILLILFSCSFVCCSQTREATITWISQKIKLYGNYSCYGHGEVGSHEYEKWSVSEDGNYLIVESFLEGKPSFTAAVRFSKIIKVPIEKFTDYGSYFELHTPPNEVKMIWADGKIQPTFGSGRFASDCDLWSNEDDLWNRMAKAFQHLAELNKIEYDKNKPKETF